MASNSRASPTAHPLRLLSIDGGGIRGLSALVILRELMHRVKKAEKLSTEPLPADYFDLICGTSTGGLIALLLGRLRLSVPEAIDKYRTLAQQIFSERKAAGKDGVFKASNLEKAIKDVLKDKLGPGRENEKMFTTDERCKIFVCAVPAKHINREPRLFRTWEADENAGYNCTIWEAARATSAAPRLFKRIYIGDPGVQEEFIDAGLGCNNPIRYLFREARREFGSNRKVGCILSIGTGQLKVAGFEAPNIFQRALPLDLIQVLKQMATDTESEASAMKERLQGFSLYHRLNVDRGLEEVSLDEWKKLGDVQTHTLAYLGTNETGETIKTIVDALVGRTEQTSTLGQLGGRAPEINSAPRHFIYPAKRVDYFISRTQPQKAIQDHFQLRNTTLRPTVIVLNGMGGCGKSQLALEYCQQCENDRSYIAILWIDAMSRTTAEQSLNHFAEELSKPDFKVENVRENIRYVLTVIGRWQAPWLLVFDNFNIPDSFAIRDYFPRSNKGSILITSRHPETRDLGHFIDVTSMSDIEALDLLYQRSGVLRKSSSLPEAERIVKRLGFHALAIDQAGAYIRARTLDLDLYLDHFTKRRGIVLNETPALWAYTRSLDSSPEEQTKLTIFTTWELSFALITGDEKLRNEKEHILTLAAFFNGKEISETLFTPYREWKKEYTEAHEGEQSEVESEEDDHGDDWATRDWDAYTLQDIFKEQQRLSLIQNMRIHKPGAVFSLHPLVQDWLKWRRTSEELRKYTIEATLVMSKFITKHEFYQMPLDVKQKTLSHLEAVLQNIQEFLSPEDRIGTSKMLNYIADFATFLQKMGQYQTAEDLYRREVEGRETLFGQTHVDTLACKQDLANLLQKFGKVDEATVLYQEIFIISKDALGDKHPITLHIILNYIAFVSAQGRFKDAELICRQMLEMSRKELGMADTHTLDIMQNLGVILYQQTKYAEAEKTFRMILDLRKDFVDCMDLNILRTMHGLASALSAQDKFAEAEPMFLDVIALSRSIFGSDHPITLNSLNGLGVLFLEQGKFDAAEPLIPEAVEVSQRSLTEENRLTMTYMDRLAELYLRQSRLDEAVTALRKVIDVRKKFQGKEHSDTLRSMQWLAEALREQGRFDELELLNKERFDVIKKTLCNGLLSKQDRLTHIHMHELAVLLHHRGDLDEAESLFQETLSLQEEVFGGKNYDSIIVLDNLAILLEVRGRLSEAEVYMRESLSLGEKIIGKEHLYTITCMISLGSLLYQQNKLDEAEQFLREAQSLGERVLGIDHRQTIRGKEVLEELEKDRIALELDRSKISDKSPEE